MAYMEYMDLTVCCPRKAVKLNQSLTRWSLGWSLGCFILIHSLISILICWYHIAHNAGLVLNYGISNTIVLEIP